MKFKYLVILFFLLLCGAPLTVVAQTEVTALEREITKAEEDLKRINQLLQSNRSSQKNSNHNMQLAAQQIKTRTALVAKLDKQIAQLSDKLGVAGQAMQSQLEELESLRASYASMIKTAYKSYRGNSEMAFLFASDSYSTALRRAFYLRNFHLTIAKRSLQIDSLQTKVEGEMSQIRTQQATFTRLIGEKATELKQLTREREQHAAMVKSLRGNEQELARQATQKEIQRKELQAKIRAIIEQESQTPPTTIVDIALSADFAKNQRALPSPVGSGVVVERFGRHRHPTQAEVMVDNRGVNIATREGAPVSAVFAGEVRRVFAVAGFGNCVIIRHGAYLSVYSNLESVSVAVGQRVEARQVIGKLTTKDPVLHFEIWNENKAVDPELWIKI